MKEEEVLRGVCPQANPGAYIQRHRTHQGFDSGLSKEGRRAVIKNIFEQIKYNQSQMASELFSNNLSHWSINAQLFSICIQLQALLDAIAKFCSHHCPNASVYSEDIYFHNYPFDANVWEKILFHRARIQDLRFHGHSFNDTANSLKHHIPWIGLVSQCAEKETHDIFDENNLGFNYDFLKIIIRETEKIIAIISSDV